MSRDELNASQLAELAALDRILAREPVGEQHLELAALVDSVRAGAPVIDPAFAEQLDARILAGRRRRAARLRIARPSMRRLAVASGGVVAAAVAVTIVISSGVFGGAAQPRALEKAPGTTLTTPRTAASTPLAPNAALGTAAKNKNGTATSGQAASPSSASTGFGPNVQARLVHRGSTLTLASSPATMQTVANRIVAATEQQGGVVESSNVDIQGSASYASFSLQLPSGRLSSLIARLSALASVRALTQNTQDITDGYNQETARLADNVAERAALLKRLATVATLTQETSIRQQLSKLAARIAAEHRELDRLLNEGHTAMLNVNVVPGPGAKPAVLGPLGRAYHDALHALEEILAIALIALAIILPFALSALALWWAATGVRQRSRERAMRAA